MNEHCAEVTKGAGLTYTRKGVWCIGSIVAFDTYRRLQEPASFSKRRQRAQENTTDCWKGMKTRPTCRDRTHGIICDRDQARRSGPTSASSLLILPGTWRRHRAIVPTNTYDSQTLRNECATVSRTRTAFHSSLHPNTS